MIHQSLDSYDICDVSYNAFRVFDLSLHDTSKTTMYLISFRVPATQRVHISRPYFKTRTGRGRPRNPGSRCISLFIEAHNRSRCPILFTLQTNNRTVTLQLFTMAIWTRIAPRQAQTRTSVNTTKCPQQNKKASLYTLFLIYGYHEEHLHHDILTTWAVPRYWLCICVRIELSSGFKPALTCWLSR